MNNFQLSYETRLQNWYNLREKIKNFELKEICIEVDRFWQQCPLTNHYLHPIDIESWPNPWELLFDNHYCVYSRALGITYTLLLLGINDIDFVEAKDYNNEDTVLVIVDNAKYILNYWPNTVVNNCLQDFKIVNHIDITPITKKIGKT
jgi:hypothetical protein